MKDEYAPRGTVILPQNCDINRPEELPELVHDHDPATTVFTDFHKEHPATIGAAAHLDHALEEMKHSGSCVLLVTDEDQQVLGQITLLQSVGRLVLV